jgi:hypothetical protein
MKKKHSSIIISLILVAAVSLTSCGRHRHVSRHNPEIFLKRMDARVKKFDLTEEQQADYSDLRARLKSDLSRDLAEMGKIPDHLIRELEREDPDIPGLAENLKAETAHMPGFDGKYIDYFVEFYTILDEEQQEELHERMRKKLTRHTRRHSRLWD